MWDDVVQEEGGLNYTEEAIRAAGPGIYCWRLRPTQYDAPSSDVHIRERYGVQRWGLCRYLW